MVKCNHCGREISVDNGYQHLGQTLCEDCYIDIRYPPKACDPWAVYTATKSRGTLGQKGTDGLTDLQQKVYDFIKKNDKVTREEILAELDVEETALQTHLATLRHCELVKGYKDGDSIYLVPFDYNEHNADSGR